MVTAKPPLRQTNVPYLCLKTIHSACQVVTFEDPQAYKPGSINLIHINTKAGLTFASFFRSMVRHNPDANFISKIRAQYSTLKI